MVTELHETKENMEAEGSVIELRELPLEEAKPIVKQYVHDHPGAWTSDVAVGTGIDLEIVLKALRELRTEGKLNSRPIRHE